MPHGCCFTLSGRHDGARTLPDLRSGETPKPAGLPSANDHVRKIMRIEARRPRQDPQIRLRQQPERSDSREFPAPRRPPRPRQRESVDRLYKHTARFHPHDRPRGRHRGKFYPGKSRESVQNPGRSIKDVLRFIRSGAAPGATLFRHLAEQALSRARGRPFGHHACSGTVRTCPNAHSPRGRAASNGQCGVTGSGRGPQTCLFFDGVALHSRHPFDAVAGRL